MITIDRLQLTLPPGFETRAGAVARRVAEELAALPAAGPLRRQRLSVPPLALEPSLGDREIARRIAAAIHGQLTQGGGEP